MKSYSLIDAVGIVHTFDKVPQRIVSLVPSQTELLVDLGLESKIVGITKFCIHPKHLKNTKCIVGGTKKVNYDKIKALKSDVIICNKEENTLEIVENLRAVCAVWVTDIVTIEDNFKMIEDFGKLLDCNIEAKLLISGLSFALSDFKQFIERKPIRKVVYFIWKNPYMVAGSDNFINELLKLNRFENIFENQPRYPEMQLQQINEAADLNFMFLSSEPYPFKQKDILEMKALVNQPGIILVDGEMFSWYGSHLLKAFAYFKELHLKL
ncbi:helical backbone metal receptor [Flavobacterium sp. ST-87]|uniref:Helical backbone metal receptor n=1 Tax=Flavobacterium plantiphilum TaxID=3163297 RepID=A0ABW8XWW8_9FLAO